MSLSILLNKNNLNKKILFNSIVSIYKGINLKWNIIGLIKFTKYYLKIYILKSVFNKKSIIKSNLSIFSSKKPLISKPNDFSTTITTLPNGLKVASEEAPGHFASVGIYIDAGSRYENDKNAGSSHLIDRLAFKVHILFYNISFIHFNIYL